VRAISILENIGKNVAAFVGVFIVVSIMCGALGYMGLANVIEEKFTGENITFDHTSATADGSFSDRAMSSNAKAISYQMSRSWNNGDVNETQTVSSSYILTTGSPVSAYMNQYMVKVVSDATGYGTTYQATKINGDFAGSTNVITTNVDLDQLTVMDGNATFHSKIVNGQSGKPVTESETDAVGKMVMSSYLNITTPKTYDDWLAFCNSFGDSLPGDICLVPTEVSQPDTADLGSNNN
jgi:hypothetical protein